ncbi:hypothetical protein [Methylocystis sp. ATCC 49242]|uniref:hypothetical protein n=1 Tax=Methylocystis sp. ATCC 49242 TaxID=622637 RepID=UPI0001F879B5|nr:hypothetical protein [Methylocystis sp. ATCC 49242]
MINRIRPYVLPFIASARLSPLMAGILVALLASTATAGLYAALAILWPQTDGSQSAAPEWKPPTLAVGELDPPKPASADVQALSRPIFSKNRRPTPKTAGVRPVTPDAEAAAPAGLSVGAIVKSGGTAQAFVISSGAPEGEWKKVGDMIDTWTVDDITSLELTLKNGEQEVKLKLYSDETEGPPDNPQEMKPEAPPANKPDAPPALTPGAPPQGAGDAGQEEPASQ